MTIEKALNTREFADLLGYHPEHLRRLIRQGRIPRPAGAHGTAAYRWRPQEVRKFLRQRERAAKRKGAGARE